MTEPLSWEERRKLVKPFPPPLDMTVAKNTCPLCQLDLRRIPAMHSELYPEFHIYTCAMWSDVHHVANVAGYSNGKNRLLRERMK